MIQLGFKQSYWLLAEMVARVHGEKRGPCCSLPDPVDRKQNGIIETHHLTRKRRSRP
jgi:hypothetical protein